jgi:GDP-4-dehydro-6-deoxy-D-mannose reductase
MKALITGINGFVGPHLKQHLINNGFEVFGTDISNGELVDYSVDLLDKQAVYDLISKITPDFIFHLAAQSSVKLSFIKSELTREINVTGTKNLLDAVKSLIPDSKILVVGSADVYGIPDETPLTENSKLNPISPYGESKLEQEKLALNYGLNLVISRSFTHTGPGQKPIFVCSDFAKQIVEIEKGKEAVINVGNIDVRRDFTDVRDMVRAYLLALEKCNFNEVYNICSGNTYSLRKILDMLLAMSDKEIQIKEDPTKLRKKDILLMEGDNSKFIEITGWKAEISLEQTLKDLLDYWRKNIN